MIRRFVVLAGIAGLLLGMQAHAFEAFVQVSKNGSALPTDHTHSWVEILGFTQGVEQTASLNSPVPQTPKAKALRATLELGPDRLLSRVLDGTCRGYAHDLVIQVPRRGAEEVSVYTEIQFKGVFFEEVHCEHGSGQERPLFGIDFRYNQVIVTVTSVGPSGVVAVGGGYDFVKALPVERPTTGPPVPGAYAGGGSVPDGDEDDDGLPDDWETANGLNPGDASDANADKDGDGFSNRDEYLAGTNPSSGNSFFRATIGGPGTATPGMITLSWNSVPGKSYKILATQDLTQPFVEVGTVPAASGSQTTTHQVPQTAGRFFKLSVGE